MKTWRPPRNTSKLAAAFIRQRAVQLLNVTGRKEPLPRDPWTFVRDCVFTQDEHADKRGLASIRKLVGPGDDYLEVLTREFTTEPKTAASKARQLRVTWLLAGLFVHDALIGRGHRLGYQTKKWDDAAAYLRDRMWFIYQHIPAKYDKPKARHIEGTIEVFHDGSELPTAWIMALGEGAQQARQWTFWWFWSDEAAFQVDQEDTHTAIQPSLDGGGRHTMTSSPCRGSYMGRILHDDLAGGEVTGELPIFKDAIYAWRRNGYRCLRVEYWADPFKAAMWPDRDTPPSGYSTRQWQQEQRNDWTVQSGEPVYCDTDRIQRRPQDYDPREPLYRFWDFGWNFPCCGFFQVDRSGKLPKLRGLMVLRGRKTEIERFAQERVLTATADNFPGAKVHDFGDPAGNAHEGTSGKSAISVLAGLGITVRTRRETVDVSSELLQTMISMGLVELDPTGCRHLIDDLSGGYHRDENGEPVKDDECDHEPDLTRYGVWNVFRYGSDGEPRVVQRIGGGDVHSIRSELPAPVRRRQDDGH